MSRLVLRLDVDGVGARLAETCSHRPLVTRTGPMGETEIEADRLWLMVLTVVGDVVWDDDSLGAATPAILTRPSATADAPLAATAALAVSDPRTWSWVLAGRCVLGPVGS